MTEKTFLQLVHHAAGLCGCTREEILDPSIRPLPVVRAREILAVCLRDRGLSYPEVSAWLGQQHPTGLYQARRFDEAIKTWRQP